MIPNDFDDEGSNNSADLTPPIRILLADDHPITLYALRSLLIVEKDFKVLGEAANGRQALDRVAEFDPDILLLDLQMPLLDGFCALQILHESNTRTKTIVLTASQDQADFVRCIKLGAAGVIRKQTPPELIVQSIRAVHSGEIWLDPEVTADVRREFAGVEKPAATSSQGSLQRIPVSAREREVVQLITQGLRNKEIAEKLFIGEQTVKNHLHSIFGKLRLSDRMSLALYAIHEGLYANELVPPVAVRIHKHLSSHDRVVSR